MFKVRPVPRPVSAGRGPGVGPGGGKAGMSCTFGMEVWTLLRFGSGRFWGLSKRGLLGRTFGPVGVGVRLFPANGSFTPGVTGSDNCLGAGLKPALGCACGLTGNGVLLNPGPLPLIELITPPFVGWKGFVPGPPGWTGVGAPGVVTVWPGVSEKTRFGAPVLNG